MKTTRAWQSKDYPRYYLVSRGGELHVAMKDKEGYDSHNDGYFSVGRLLYVENFETACNNAEEEFRSMLG